MMGIEDVFFGTTKLNFDPDEFHSDSFSVDFFIQRKRQSVPLDVLRDDLGVHLKTLRSSLIELINQDYGQFVNLSSNLVGLDGRIQSIVGPLSRARNDIQGFDQLLEASMSSLESELGKKRRAREGKAQIQYLRMASRGIQTSEKLVLKLPPEILSSTDFNSLKTVCDEVAEARFLLQCCSKSALQIKLDQEWNLICNLVLGKFNHLLKAYADISYANASDSTKDDDTISVVKSLLYMYTELQCERTVEEVMVKEIITPKFETVLKQKGNVDALLESAEMFCNRSPLFVVWRQLDKNPWMATYNFIARGVFPCILKILNKHFPHIWSPSNPESFHSNWTRFEKFITTLEESLPSLEHLNEFRHSDALQEFMSKWQFPVYFQLRFHSLATELESALEDVSLPCSNSDFKLDATRVMVKVIQQCWDKDSLFISRMSARFLKASALLVARYIKELQLKIGSNKGSSVQMFIHAYCDLSLGELVVRQVLTQKMAENLSIADGHSSNSLQFLSDFAWNDARNAIIANLLELTISQCSNSIAAVNEVPRLYRRTNRETPTKHLDYVEAILSPLCSLKEQIYNAHQQELWEKVGDKVASQIVQRYQAQVQEVLVSVQRMEESLRRLKKVKGQNQATDAAKGSTDDDKIRLQIQIDVKYFVQEVAETVPSVNTAPIQSLFKDANGTL